MRRLLRSLSLALMVAGVLLIADAAITVLWQEPASALYGALTQDRLSGELERIERRRPSRPQLRALDELRGERRRMAFLARVLRRDAREGEPIGRIKAGRAGIDTVIVAGTRSASLRNGPGHLDGTALPGLRGTVAVAGHRTTYGAPFRRVDRFRAGDEIVVEMPYGRFVYRVERTQIVAPTAISVTRSVSFDRLVLSACHPLYSAEQRIIVFARLVATTARGAALMPTLRRRPPTRASDGATRED